MKDSTSIIQDIWYSYKGYLGQQSVSKEQPSFEEMIAGFFCPGPFYYYVIDSPTLTFDYVSDNISLLMGVNREEATLPWMIETIHPDDIPFMARCEDLVADFIRNKIQPDQIVNYKISYMLREKTASGEYRLFLLQTITLRTTENGSLLKVFGLHTDISHITNENNYKLSLIGLNGCPSYLSMDVMDPGMIHFNEAFSPLTKREQQIIKLLGEGLTVKEIAAALSISSETVVTHKKNAMARIGGKNVTELVALCIRKGYI